MAQTGEKYTQARRGLTSSVGPLARGEVRTVVVAWRLDDPAVEGDGRFWMVVPEAAGHLFQDPVGAIVPRGEPLRCWRERADGEEVEVSNPISRARERFSLARWSGANPDSTRVVVSFEHRDEELVGRSPDEAHQIRLARDPRRTWTPITPELAPEAQRLKAEQADLQQRYREALERGDEREMGELRPRLEAIVDELARAAFPHYSRTWNLGKAIREDHHCFVLDWTTGY
jgi:hypothetical protein